MARNGSGTYSLPQAPFVSGTVISSTAVNSDFSDIATALTQSIASDGQTPITANLPMSGYKHTGVANATARTDYAATGQVQDGSFTWCGTAGGTADALTLTPTPAISAYQAGQLFRFTAGASPNTGAATVAVSGLTAKAIQNGGSALAAGDIAAGRQYEILYDGTQFQLQSYALSSIADGSITNAKLANMAANTVKARAANSSGVPSDVALAASELLGRGSTGDVAAIALGTNLSMSGTTLSATGGGKILQVVQTTKTDTTSTTSTSLVDITGMSVSITPSSASSRVLVLAMISTGANPNTYAGHIALLRGSTATPVGDAAGSRTQATIANGNNANNTAAGATITAVDSPATTSSVTYKLQWAVESGATLYLNRSNTDSNSATGGRYASTIIAMEIGP